MSNYKKDKFFIEIAEFFAKQSHCVSVQVGAVCVKDNRIITTGINGTPSGYLNCDDKFSALISENKEDHHKWSNIHEIHAEMNIILYAARYGISLNNATLYCNIEPCIYCTKNLMNSGIIRIVYKTEYYRNRNNTQLKKFIEEHKDKIKFEKL